MLRLISVGQQAGFSLDELRRLLPGDLTRWEHGTLLETLRLKVQEIKTLQARLAQSKAQLTDLIAQIETLRLQRFRGLLDVLRNGGRRIFGRSRGDEQHASTVEPLYFGRY